MILCDWCERKDNWATGYKNMVTRVSLAIFASEKDRGNGKTSNDWSAEICGSCKELLVELIKQHLIFTCEFRDKCKAARVKDELVNGDK